MTGERLRGQRNQEPPWARAYCLWAKGDVDKPLSENGPAVFAQVPTHVCRRGSGTLDCEVS